jgi:hypothetical protein
MTLSEYTKAVMEKLMADPLILPPLAPVKLVNENSGLIAENWEYGEPVENTAIMIRIHHLKREKRDDTNT